MHHYQCWHLLLIPTLTVFSNSLHNYCEIVTLAAVVRSSIANVCRCVVLELPGSVKLPWLVKQLYNTSWEIGSQILSYKISWAKQIAMLSDTQSIKDNFLFHWSSYLKYLLNLWEDLAILGLKRVIVLVEPAAAKQGQDGAQQRLTV